MRLLLVVLLVLAFCGCAKDNPSFQMTVQQCKDLLKVASLGVSECDRLEDADKVAKCKHYTEASIALASAACGFIPETEEE